MNANGNIALIEDHHEALRIWREKKVNNLDLVHIDAHLDFGFHAAKPIKQVIDEAKTVKDLKASLEKSLAFNCYERDFEKQTNIGNYIYPAMREGIVRDFYWVIPGGPKEFKKSRKYLRTLIRNLTKQDPYRSSYKFGEGLITTSLLGKKFVICILDKLPTLRQKLLLDIDTDFLVVDNLKNANTTLMIGKRKPWIMPAELVSALRKRIKNPAYITIAYSVNGGFTPMKYKHLGDEMAYYLSPKHFDACFNRNFKASEYFNLFCSTGEKGHYQKAVEINPAYRAQDNNYGPLYLSLRKFSLAQDEFLKALKADPKNPACLLGLGNIALEKKDFKRAKKYFSPALDSGNHTLFTPLDSKHLTEFTKVKNQSLLGLGRAEFGLKNLKRAKELLFRYQPRQPLQSQSYYLLGRIFEKEKDFERSTVLYKDAIRLGFGSIEPISRLLRISPHLEERDDIIKYVIAKYKEFKKRFTRTKRLSLKKTKRVKGLLKIEKKMLAFEKRLEKIKKPSTKRKEV